MIKFFRKIRQQLLSDNDSSNYLIYAIGEIILVVIGILIALAINDFYQKRITIKEEYSLLESLREDFIETKERTENTIKLQKKVVNYSDKLETIMLKRNNEVDFDSIGNYLYAGAFSFWKIEPVTGTYTAIINSGKIGILQNKRLKRLLAEFSAEIEFGFGDEKYCLELTTLLAEKASKYSYFLQPKFMKPIDVENEQKENAIVQHLKNDSFLGILNMKTGLENNRLYYQKEILNSVNNIITIIKADLETKK